MLNFGNSGAGAGGSQLWKFISGTSPDDIELNTGAGVLGIDAPNPDEPIIRLFSKTIPIGPAQFTGVLSEYRNYYCVNGVVMNTGDPLNKQFTPFVAQIDDTTNTSAIIDFGINSNDVAISVDDSNQLSVRNSKKDALRDIVGDMTTGDNSFHFQSKAQFLTLIEVAGTQTIIEVLSSDDWQIKDGGNNTVFVIRKDGAIYTNQAVAPAVRGAKINDLPIYDAAGSLLGYIPIFAP